MLAAKKNSLFIMGSLFLSIWQKEPICLLKTDIEGNINVSLLILTCSFIKCCFKNIQQILNSVKKHYQSTGGPSEATL